MPEQVKIGDNEICTDYYKTKLFKRKAGQPRSEVLLFEGGIGVFIDIIYQNDILTARTTEGWFFSKTEGESWFSEEEAEENGLSLGLKFKGHYTFKKNYLAEYIKDELNDNNQFEFTVEQRVNATNFPCLELVELENDAAIDEFIDRCMKIQKSTGYPKFFIFEPKKTDFIKKRLFEHHLKDGRFVLKKRILHDRSSIFCFMPDYGVENLRNFDYNLMRSKRAHGTTLFIINDFMLFFKKYKDLDFIESTLRNLCHTASRLDVRIMITYSKKSQKLNQKAIDFISNFKHKLVDHLVQVHSDEDKKELIVRERIV